MKKIKPLPPRSVLRLKKLWPHARKQGHEIGEIRRVGYYSPQDGLDCVWLVDNCGNYNWTADHDWVFEKFEIVELSDETDLFGRTRRRLGQIGVKYRRTSPSSARATARR
jgi:hypothetical protein